MTWLVEIYVCSDSDLCPYLQHSAQRPTLCTACPAPQDFAQHVNKIPCSVHPVWKVFLMTIWLLGMVSKTCLRYPSVNLVSTTTKRVFLDKQNWNWNFVLKSNGLLGNHCGVWTIECKSIIGSTLENNNKSQVLVRCGHLTTQYPHPYQKQHPGLEIGNMCPQDVLTKRICGVCESGIWLNKFLWCLKAQRCWDSEFLPTRSWNVEFFPS